MTPLAPIVNHIWQSTLFAAIVALATLAFRRNRAAVRHALWLAASAKFLVPFGALVALGSALGPLVPSPAVHRNVMQFVIVSAGPPFSRDLPLLAPGPVSPPAPETLNPRVVAIAAIVWLAGAVAVLATSVIKWRRVAAIVRGGVRLERGADVDVLRRLEQRADVPRPVPMVVSSAPLEPGVFGIIRPVLLWPASIGEHLRDDQLATILAHEVAHVRRRDNLAAAVQTVVEAIFWFHPLVWWIGARLVEERERACDEEVVREGGEPAVYAETILTACRVFLEAPRACVAGVTGSDLNARIERIMTNAATRRLSMANRCLLTACSLAALLVPVAVGVLNAPPVQARTLRLARAINQKRPEFEVASIKPNKSGPGPVRIETLPGGRFTATNVTLRNLIQFAYRLQPFQIADGHDWISADRFDIIAKGDETDDGNQFTAEQAGEPSRTQLMLQSLLAERFKLIVRTEPKEQPMYSLVLARSDLRLGSSLSRSTVDCSVEKERTARNVVKVPSDGVAPTCGIRMGMGSLMMGGATLAQFARTLSGILERTVTDRTGLTGTFDATVKWTPDQSTPGFAEKARYVPTIDPNGPSIFTALQEQLGLKLDATKGQLDMLHIVSADHPTPN